jgi:predicted phosphodiesterase
MQIAVLADIHGNLPALEAVASEIEGLRPDLVFVAGDFQNRGPNPREVTEFVVGSGWTLLRGNHEDYVIWQSEEGLPHDPVDYFNWLPARWTAELTGDFVDLIKKLPIMTTFIGPNETAVSIAHGSPRSNNEGFFPKTADAKAIEMIGENPPGLLCVGHSHLPLVRQINSTLLVNVGSVGFPFDGDQRASFGLITWNKDHWIVEIRRIAYRIKKVIDQLDQVNFYEGTGPLSWLIRRELESARPHLSPFESLFGSLVRNGSLTIHAAIKRYMEMPQTEIEAAFVCALNKQADRATIENKARPQAAR